MSDRTGDTVSDGPSAPQPLVVQKLHYDGEKSYRWEGRQVCRDADLLFFTAVFVGKRRDLGYVTFDAGDVFYEYYYFDRWFNVFQVYSAQGELRGWYCNVTRPPTVQDGELRFVDLALDVFAYPDRTHVVLDQEEFDELARTTYSAEHVERANAALAELVGMATDGTLPGRPFGGPEPVDGPFGNSESAAGPRGA